MKYLNKIARGDCRDLMPELPDNSIPALVTDPPYGLGFMGKEWDTLDKSQFGQAGLEGQGDLKVKKNFRILPRYQSSNGIYLFMLSWATEALRVLRPGAHALVFGGTRTYHRMVCALEDAGFEVRDTVLFLHGQGFPKNYNISKGIDKRGGKPVSWFGKWLREWRAQNNITQKEIAELFPSRTGGLTGCVANWELGLNMPTCEQFNLICKTFKLPFETLEEAHREVIGKDKNWGQAGTVPLTGYKEFDITLAATPEAKQWQGWGTALKPAVELICLARKPLSERNIVENVLKHGTGGMNIDGSRIGFEEVSVHDAPKGTFAGGEQGRGSIKNYRTHRGRWPANLILDSQSAALLDEQSGTLDTHKGQYKQSNAKSVFGAGEADYNLNRTVSLGDFGGASRFFYCAKASRRERDMGLEGLEAKQRDETRKEGKPGGDNPRNRGVKKVLNNHPTVKPLKLMEYLVNLITPPGGIVLDPFIGSGTTAMACKKLGFDYIGFEKEAEYVEIARARVAAVEKGLF